MTGWLLDTNVLSELRRVRPNAKVVAFIKARPLDILYISSVTLAEIRFGIELVAEPGRRAELTNWLTHRVLPKEGRKIGHTFSQPDLIIGATALEHGLTVASRDISDYEKARVPAVNPWLAAAGR